MQSQTKPEVELLVIFASETGNCEQISSDLYQDLKTKHSQQSSVMTKAKYGSLNQFKELGLTDKNALKVVIFMTSSTGDGEFPENGLKFQKYLRLENDTRALSHVSYAILGLGDSNYSKFQGAPRFLDQRLKDLGATTFFPRVEADEATSLEKYVEPFLKNVIEPLKAEIARLQTVDDARELLRVSETQIIESQDELFLIEDAGTSVYTAKLLSRDTVAQDDHKTVFEISLKLGRPAKRDRLDVGQSIGITPQNRNEDVNRIIDFFDWDREMLIGNKTLEEMLLTEIDIASRKVNLKSIAESILMVSEDASSDLEKLLLSEAEASKYTLLELVEHCKPFSEEKFMLTELAVESLPRMKNRYFSILYDPYQGGNQSECDTLTLCFTLHSFKDQFGNSRQGLATTYLATCPLGSEIKCNISKNTRVLKLPAQITPDTKMLMVCMGTGVVPFISMLDRLSKTECQVHLVYGVRNDTSLCFYREWLTKWFAGRPNCQLSIACSRQLSSASSQLELSSSSGSNISMSKGYLQDCYLRRFNLQAWKFSQDESAQTVDTNTHVMVCGNKNALKKTVLDNLRVDTETQEKMKLSGQLLMELWNE